MLFAKSVPALAAAALVASVLAAQSQAPATPAPQAIPIDRAMKIAGENGMVQITKAELDDGEWELEGRAGAGARLEIDLRATDGSVVKIEKDGRTTRP